MQIDAGLGQVVATNTSQIPYYLVGDKWIRLPDSLKHITVGPAGIWSINSETKISKYVAGNWVTYLFFQLNLNCQNKGWSHIDGKLSMIEVATDGSVFGVNSAGDVFTRDGITASKPEGTGWSNVPMYMPKKHETYDLGRLWVVSKTGVTMVCTH
ncbi:fish-egg lectin-like [Salvelinus fontinalis]|uniref:fish-egg lectin-like n=1 Tax=Salvelinus fontinalis TaxID=8038 RepID=UPI0024853016|nr:fish-egg lectin-like [Salvelinus fontinalis]